jgi:N-acetyl-anhydromuramyl-L-alanine amidase AmpD
VNEPFFILPSKIATRPSTRRRKPTGVMLHWSGGNRDAKRLAEYTDGRVGGWYHYIVDEHGAWEYADPARHRGAHAGRGWNDDLIGVCIAHPILVSTGADRQIRARGLDERPAAWGTQRVYSLTPAVCTITARAVLTLCRIHGIAPDVWQGGRRAYAPGQAWGIMGHHQVAGTTKWDPAPWWVDISMEIACLRHERSSPA